MRYHKNQIGGFKILSDNVCNTFDMNIIKAKKSVIRKYGNCVFVKIKFM